MSESSGRPGFLFLPGVGSRTRSFFPEAWRRVSGSLLLVDVWKVREVFLGLKSEQEFLDFLNEVGCFLPTSDIRKSGALWELDSLRSWQTVFCQLLMRSPDSWYELIAMRKKSNPNDPNWPVLVRASHVTLQFQWHRKGQSYVPGVAYTAVLKTFDVVSAILATIYLDRLRGAIFGFCARDDCRKVYEITSNHKRKYCEQYCAHLASLRRMRKQKAEKEAQKKTSQHPDDE